MRHATEKSEAMAGCSKKNQMHFEDQDLLCVAYVNPQTRSDLRPPARPTKAAIKATDRASKFLGWLI